MKATFIKQLYPANEKSEETFNITVYKLDETITLPDGTDLVKGKKISCKGHLLPKLLGVVYDFTGKWVKSSKYGWSFDVAGYTESIIPTENNIVKYLSSGQIKGIGEKIAQRIYDAFGDSALDILDKNPDRLLEIKGISEKKLERIIESYLANRGARDVLQFLLPYGVTPKKSVMFYKKYGIDAIHVVKEQPYTLCELHGIGFKIADSIALKMGMDRLSDIRIDNCILYVLAKGETEGNTCLPATLLIDKTIENLDTPEVTGELIEASIERLLNKKKIIEREGSYFLTVTDIKESRLAENILHRAGLPVHVTVDPHTFEDTIEQKLGFRLADEQLDAVKAALTNPITIITGGPGTGKTAIQKAIITLFEIQHPCGTVTCCAPTGKAARRMAEATGHTSSTIHKAIGLRADDDGNYKNVSPLKSDLVIVDEVSMLDNSLADALFRALTSDKQQVVLVGDVDQLPSVGAGQVLKDLIDSGVVPVVRLETVYRQDAGSRIALNALNIKRKTDQFVYGSDFQFTDAVTDCQAQTIAVELYDKQVAEFGIDNVVFLSPYRNKSETGTRTINPILRDRINPPHPFKPEMKVGRDTVFRKGDKVIQMRNRGEIANGDVGYITEIAIEDGEKIANIDFGDNRIVRYYADEMADVDLAYALTVHKVQGSEYKSCIITLQMLHFIMLNRPLIYTAITRARERVTIIGERRALHIAVQSESKERRYTGLLRKLVSANTTQYVQLCL